MKRLPLKLAIAATIVSAILILGCPRNSIKVGENLYLEKFHENGKFYLRTFGDGSTGGVMEGTISDIGWNEEYVIAKVNRLYKGDASGWYVFDISHRRLEGPILEKNLRTDERFSGIKIEPAEITLRRNR